MINNMNKLSQASNVQQNFSELNDIFEQKFVSFLRIKQNNEFLIRNAFDLNLYKIVVEETQQFSNNLNCWLK
jgi:hypothetical protein